MIFAGGQYRKLLARPELPGSPQRLLAHRARNIAFEPVDLRGYDGPVLDQGQRGTCVDFATISMHQSLVIKELVESGLSVDDARARLPQLSALFLDYYAKLAEGRDPKDDTGLFIGSPLRAMSAVGCCLEELWPYTDNPAAYGVEPSEEARAQALQHKNVLDFDLPSHEDMLQSLADGFGFIVGVTVYDGFGSAPDGVIPLPPAGATPRGGHGIHIDGWLWLKGVGHFIVKNSWSPGWGDNGYGYLPFGYPMWSAKTQRRASDAEVMP